MKQRPLSITITSWGFIVLGCTGILVDVVPWIHSVMSGDAARGIDIKAEISRFAAIVSGVYMLQGFNWARWLLVAWLAFHVGLSAFHTVDQVIVHLALSAVVIYVLFRGRASAYFCSAGPAS